jgi:preprotein translocase subunit SecA
VVYSTAKELLGDYLRDRLAIGQHPSRVRQALAFASGLPSGQRSTVMRGIWQVIVDEADSVLIDEAVTPLIISAQRPDDLLDQAAGEAVGLARQLEPGRDFRLQRALRHIELTEAGKNRLGELAERLQPFWRNAGRTRELVEMALYAQHMMRRDQHYVVEEDKVVLVDELTGRLARQRTLSLGMQQLLEASLDLPVSPPSEVSARLSFQRFFRLFRRLGGMTGTAEEARGEFQQVYRLATLRIPTHRPVQRQHWPSRVLVDEAAKFAAIAESAVSLAETGRAVLIGMRSVRTSEALHRYLRELKPGVSVNVLHAVNHAQESAIVAQAGKAGALTIATNMAGRGTDIALDDTVREAGGLHVILGESNDFSRIDRQLVGRCARQGDPGSVQRFIALDDELVQRFLPVWLGRFWTLQHRRWPRADKIVALILLGLAQWRAERLAFKQRENILKQDIELDRIGL